MLTRDYRTRRHCNQGGRLAASRIASSSRGKDQRAASTSRISDLSSRNQPGRAGDQSVCADTLRRSRPSWTTLHFDHARLLRAPDAGLEGGSRRPARRLLRGARHHLERNSVQPFSGTNARSGGRLQQRRRLGSVLRPHSNSPPRSSLTIARAAFLISPSRSRLGSSISTPRSIKARTTSSGSTPALLASRFTETERRMVQTVA